MPEILETLDSAIDLHGKSAKELKQVADEIREVLCGLLSIRTAHFASNLGVVELCLALHSTFDFRHDRLIWDTGHQVYPHKLVTGRYKDFANIRTRGGLMGYPNPAESEYDLFMTGHAGCSISTALGLQSGDDIRGEGNRKSVAVIGDGAFPSGIVFEALNNAGELKSDLLMILNDNRMSICPRVGSVATYLDRLRTNPFYTGLKTEVVRMLNHVPVFGDPAERMLAQIKEGVKAGLHGGMLFEELGIRYASELCGRVGATEQTEYGQDQGGYQECPNREVQERFLDFEERFPAKCLVDQRLVQGIERDRGEDAAEESHQGSHAGCPPP